jgi:hypothetical protein
MLIGRPARATLSRAVRVEELVARSRHVLLGEPLESYSAWEKLGDRKHIVTYTRVRAHELLSGADPQQEEILVRTLGGRVGELGELVHGEARLRVGDRGVLFVMPVQDVLSVTAMAQGHYPLRRDRAGIELLERSPAAIELLDDDASSAVRRLPGLRVTQARSLLEQAVKR